MSVTLKGVAFLKDTHPDYAVGKRVILTVTIEPTAPQITSLDDAAGAEVELTAVPVTAYTLILDDGTDPTSVAVPAAIDVTVGYVQEVYAETGQRMISAQVIDQDGDYFTGSTTVAAFEVLGTVWAAEIEAAPPADTEDPGTGLLGRWFANRELAGQFTAETVGIPILTGNVGSVYPGGWPPAQVPRDSKYSVRFTGRIKYPSTGGWRLRVTSDDGFRLYLEGRLELDYWSDQNQAQRLTGTFQRDADDLDTIWIEHYNQGTDDVGVLRLEWSVDGGAFSQVPATALYSTDGTEALPPALPPPQQMSFYVEDVNRYDET